ncbi:flavin reductase [Acinetobacter stercoris]|uniref:FMN reductase (NADH) RutF n=1 Tax=Acinetobacter stercoris TaxID=2126983 RepID=A0A2U3MZ47_9GAMM|nr:MULTISPECIES: flavin reductase [Acinetobacter]SPL70655.1 FMN reductase (NADH) RutF [Acinetobacter stercoris]
MVETTDFRNGMSLLTGAVNVITTAGETGRFGFTASAVCSVTDDPPTLLVCMNRSSSSHAHFKENGILTVNVLGSQHQNVSQAFASKISMEERFDHGKWITLVTGSPVLQDALVSFDCKIRQMNDVGTHTIFYCEVEAIQMNQNDELHGLIYFNRAYHHVGKLRL